MTFTSGDSFALKAALLSGGGGAVIRQTATAIFSDTAGNQTYILSGVANIEAALAGNASISFQPSDGTAPGTLGIVVTIPRNGGSITAAGVGGGVTASPVIEQWESDSNTYKHFNISFTLPSPGSNLEWQVVVDPSTTVTGPASPLVLQHIALVRPHAAILD